MKKVWILALAILLALPAMAGIVAASGHHDSEHQNEHSAYFGQFEYSNGAVKGEFVSFQVDPKSGVIENYTVDNTTIFEKISYENTTMGRVKVSGARFFYYGVASPFGWNNTHKRGYMWRVVIVHDTPVGVLHIVTHGQDVLRYKLADGINATISNSTITLSGRVSAYLFVSHAIPSMQNDTIYIKTEGNRTASAVFVEPANVNVPKKIKNMEIRSLQKHKLGGEMYIGPKGTDFVNYTYGVNAKVLMKERNHIQVQVSAQGVNGGRIMVLNVNRTMLNYNSSTRLMVKFDGKAINETSVDALLNGSTQPMYAVSYNNDTVSLAVYIPHFSEHVIDIQSEVNSTGSNGGGTTNSGTTTNGNTNENSESSGIMSGATLWGIVAAIIVIVIVVIVAVAARAKSH